MEELKPCPFCGREPEIQPRPKIWKDAEKRCCCPSSNCAGGKCYVSFESWNRRS